MSSLRRIQASRANGARSQGPLTPEGKARSAQNSRTHSLTAQTLPASGEDGTQFEELHSAYLAQYQPQNQTQFDMIQEMAVCKWRQRRAWTLETAMIDLEMDRQSPQIAADYPEIQDAVRMALAVQSLTDHSRILTSLSHHEFRNARRWAKNMQTLDRQLSRPETLQPDNQKEKNEPTPNFGQQAA